MSSLVCQFMLNSQASKAVKVCMLFTQNVGEIGFTEISHEYQNINLISIEFDTI